MDNMDRASVRDITNGAQFVPEKVLQARWERHNVSFKQGCKNPCCWYWEFADGKKIYHWNHEWHQWVALKNKIVLNNENSNAGACPLCQNPHTSGGLVFSY